MKFDTDVIKKTVMEIAQQAINVGQNVGAELSEAASKAVASATKNKIQLPIIPKPAGAKPSGGSGALGPAEPYRPMKFPYTFTAKLVQFPWVYYVKNNWVYKYYAISIIVCLPIFKKISNVFNSPTNVKKWEEIKRKEREAEIEHDH